MSALKGIRSAAIVLLFAHLFPGTAESELRDLVASGRLSDLRWPDFADSKAELQRFYQPTGYALAWTNQGAVTGLAQAIIEAFRNAAAKGLDPEDYDGSRWRDRVKALRSDARSDSALARFDVALTASLMRYMSDLRFGKADPGLYHTAFDSSDTERDLAGFIRDQLVHASDAQTALNAIEPQFEEYRRTEQALQRYLRLAGEPGIQLPPLSKKSVDPGSSYAAAPQLAELLRRLGDLSPTAAVTLQAAVYSGSLVDAVKHFQARHGLDADGRIGVATQRQLNTPMSARVRQLQLSLERWRWLPPQFSRPPIIVNIPEFELRALDVSLRTELAMKVVVGKAYLHEPPVFTANMSYLIFRPYWEVPISIQRAEIVPALEKDHSYLVKNRFELMDAKNQAARSTMVDAALLKKLRSGELHVRQTPGPENSLGLVKFMFSNPYDVYLHATPAQSFSRGPAAISATAAFASSIRWN